jgi:hypothetical protein
MILKASEISEAFLLIPSAINAASPAGMLFNLFTYTL